jgi:hypothetical protein
MSTRCQSRPNGANYPSPWFQPRVSGIKIHRALKGGTNRAVLRSPLQGSVSFGFLSRGCTPGWGKSPLRGLASLSVFTMAALLSGCCTCEEQITYSDKNGDGKIDSELHHFTHSYDADWELLDTDFNGRYDKRVSYSIGVCSESVDLPVTNEWEASISKVVIARPDDAKKR